MSKRLLMLSTATAALVTGAAFATDTTILSTDAKTEPYTTGTLFTTGGTTDTGTANAGNITVKSGGSVAVSGLAQGAITIDTAPTYTPLGALITPSHWLLSQGTISNKDKDGAMAIHVDMSSNPDFTGTSITSLNAGGSTAVPTGIYLDSTSVTTVSGSGTGKHGIFLDTANCAAVCTFKGAITLYAGSILEVTGDGSTSNATAAIQIGSASSTASTYGVLNGKLTIDGTVSAAASTTGNNSGTSLGVFGLLSYGKIDGDLTIGGSITASGEGAVGMVIAGQGITGALDINKTLASSILYEQTNYNPNQKINTTTNPEAGSALVILASIGKGVSIGTNGQVSSQGSSPVVLIGSSAQTSQVILGPYSDSSGSKFSFYNRGAISSNNTNFNRPSYAMQLSGGGTGAETILSGGLYTSGSMSASATTSNDAASSSGIAAYGLKIDSNVKLQPNGSGTTASSTSPGEQAALVVGTSSTAAGSITASVAGTRGGTAVGISIANGANVPSLINTGTISATVQTTDAALMGNTTGSADPLAAYGILSASNTLASIVNSGTIQAAAGYGTSYTALANNSQIAIAIQVMGNTTGTSIKNYAYGSQRASILGGINFGSGNNQVLDLQGNGSKTITDGCLQYTSCVIGNINYGSIAAGTISGDSLRVGSFAYLAGAVTTPTYDPQDLGKGAGVQVDVEANGRLDLQNTLWALDATAVTVQSNGTMKLGVNRHLTTSGMIAAQSVTFVNGANLGVTYASFLPKAGQLTGTSFVLMSSTVGQMSIGQSVVDNFNNAVDFNGNSTRPYLLKTATMCNTNNGTCAGFSKPDSTKDYLLINVLMKGAVDPNPNVADHLTDPTVDANTGVHTANYIGLTANSAAVTPLAKLNCTVTSTNTCVTTLFEQANLALGIDDDLGAAFINGIHNAKDAAKAYNNMAPGVTGGTRAIAISITDQATGPVASRQRALRMYGKASGDFTVWGQEFVQMIKDPGSGAIDPNTGFKTNPGFRDHGFGMSVGIDGGSPKSGWYGGAITFYAGDVNELARDAHQNQQWYVASLYSVWRGKGLFFDAKVDAGYGNIDGKRTLVLQPTSTTYTARQATNKHAGALLSGGFSTGGMFSYGAATFTPQLSVDGLYVREEGYTEKNPGTTTLGDGFDLKVNQSYAKSLRAFLGLDVRYDLKLWDFYLQPEARAGYRYDFINDPAKIKAAFAYADTTGAVAAAGETFELTGPDPSQGNFVLGASLAASADTWTLGLNFDLVKGSSGAFQQVATVHLLGRI